MKRTTAPATNTPFQHTFRAAHRQISTALDADAKYLYRLPSKGKADPQHEAAYKKRGALRKLPMLAAVLRTNKDFKAGAMRLYANARNAEVQAAIAFVLMRTDCTKLTPQYRRHLAVLDAEEQRQHRVAIDQQRESVLAECVPVTTPAVATPASPRFLRFKGAMGQDPAQQSMQAPSRRVSLPSDRAPTSAFQSEQAYQVPDGFLDALDKELEFDLAPREPAPVLHSEPAFTARPAYLKTAEQHLSDRAKLLAEMNSRSRLALANRYQIPLREMHQMAQLLDDTWAYSDPQFAAQLKTFTDKPGYAMGPHPISYFLKATPILAFVDDSTARQLAQMAALEAGG